MKRIDIIKKDLARAVSNEELQATINALEKRRVYLHKAHPKKLLFDLLVNALLSSAIQFLFLSPTGPFHILFINKLTKYFKQYDASLKWLFSKLKYFKKMELRNQYQRLYAELPEFIKSLNKLGLTINSTCSNVVQHPTLPFSVSLKPGTVLSGVHLDFNVNNLNPALASEKYLFNIIQICNGGFKGIQREMTRFIKHHSRYVSMFLLRPKVLFGISVLSKAMYAAINSLYGHNIERILPMTPQLALEGKSNQSLRKRYRSLLTDSALLNNEIKLINTRLLYFSVVIFLMVVSYIVFVELPAAPILSSLISLTFFGLNYAKEQYRLRRVVSDTARDVKLLEGWFNRRFTLCQTKGIANSTLDQSLLLIHSDDPFILQSLVHVFHFKEIICEIRNGCLRVYLDEQHNHFHKDDEFYDLCGRVYARLRALDVVKNGMPRGIVLLPHIGDDSLPILYFVLEEAKKEVVDRLVEDPNISQITKATSALDCQFIIRGMLSEKTTRLLEENSINDLSESQSSAVYSNPYQHTFFQPSKCHSKTTPVRKKIAPDAGLNNEAVERVAHFVPRKKVTIMWPSGLVYSSDARDNTAQIAQLHSNNCSYPVFVYLGNVNSLTDDRILQKHITSGFERAKLVGPAGQQGFKLEYGTLVYKTLGSNHRLVPCYIEYSKDRRYALFHYTHPKRTVLANAHKALERLSHVPHDLFYKFRR